MRLRSATILGREVPFIMPWDDRQVMEGVIDLIYRLDGELWIADYKTDETAEEAPKPLSLIPSRFIGKRQRSAWACRACLYTFCFFGAGTSVELT